MMDMKLFFALLCAALVFFVSGCVSYSYTGKAGETPSENVAVFSDSAKIGRPYQVLGQAVVSGNYQQVSRDRMMEKLTSEARKNGADAVLIVEQQVLPRHVIANTGNKGFFTAFDYDDTNRSWGELYRDVDLTIGNIGKKPASAENTGIAEYRRIIRAEFLRYTSAKKDPAQK